MRQFRQRIRLIHELRELRATEEITNHCAERLRIDQLLRRHAIDIDVEQSHALFDQTLRAGQANAALVRQKFTDRAHTTAAQVIDIIERAFTATQVDQVFDRGDEIFVGKNALGKIDIYT